MMGELRFFGTHLTHVVNIPTIIEINQSNINKLETDEILQVFRLDNDNFCVINTSTLFNQGEKY